MNRLVLLLLLLLPSIAPAIALASKPETSATAPWKLQDGEYDSSVMGSWILPLPHSTSAPGAFAAMHDAVMFMSADNGGLSRAIELKSTNPDDLKNLGLRWEQVNGGRGFSASACGGFNSIPGMDQFCSVNGQDLSAPGVRGPVVYGGPPVATGKYPVSGVATGPWPDSISEDDLQTIATICLAPDDAKHLATGLAYRANQFISVSPDAGRQWFPLSPQCSVTQVDTTAHRAVAADAGMPGHVVVASRMGSDVGGCQPSMKDCRRRQIAWTWDVGPH